MKHEILNAELERLSEIDDNSSCKEARVCMQHPFYVIKFLGQLRLTVEFIALRFLKIKEEENLLKLIRNLLEHGLESS